MLRSCGGVAERLKALVLKTREVSTTSVGSNPTPSATRPLVPDWRATKYGDRSCRVRSWRKKATDRTDDERPRVHAADRRNASMRASTCSHLMLLKNASTYWPAAAPKSIWYECSYISMTRSGTVIGGECM
jgi:hypothetical protein